MHRDTELLTKLLEITDACFRLGIVSAIRLDLRGSAPPYSPITELMADLFDASDSVCGYAMQAQAVGDPAAGDRRYAARQFR